MTPKEVDVSENWSDAFASATTDAMGIYDDIFVPRLFEPWTDLLLDELALVPGEAVLDVAAGPGTVARRAAARVGRSGAVTACDISPAMLARARTKPPVRDGAPIRYQECPADALTVGDDAFDVVTCQQGIQFFADRPAALAEMRRAARPGARIGIAVWCAIDESPFFAALAGALGKALGDEVAAAYRSGPWGLGDADQLEQLAIDAGMSDVRVTRHQLPVIFEGGVPQLVATLAAASVAPQVAALDDAGRTRLRHAAEETLASMIDRGAVRSEAASHFLLAKA
jgi:SAM-dependent methyltransferase